MEGDFRRSSHNKHDERADDSSDCRMGKATRASRIDEERQAYKKGRLVSKHEGIRGKHSQVTLTNQFSGDNDYVRRWLAQTGEQANQHRSENREARQRTPSHSEPKTYIDVGIPYPALLDEFTGPLSRRKRKHKDSSDSSLLEAPVRLKSQPLRGSNSETEIRAQKGECAQLRKKQKAERSQPEKSTSSLASSTPKKEAFERRARHKTREDRYELKEKGKRPRNNEEAKMPIKKREKISDRRKAAKKAGEDLMLKFSSKNIGQERLTIRPSQGLGLFKNGRASSPVQRRVPDLAFSEMDFLQRSTRQLSSVKEEKICSKSREKEKRKAGRAQDEISKFFKLKKRPLQSIDLNQGSRRSSTKKTGRHAGYSNGAEPAFLRRHDRCSQSLDLTKKSNLDFGTIGPTSDILSHSLRHSPMTSHSRDIDDSARKLSGRAMTYTSWSGKEISKVAMSRDLSNTSRRTRESLTPESVRRSLEKTGIFRDTGISLPLPAGVSLDTQEIPSKRDQKRATATSTMILRIDTPASTGKSTPSAGARSRELNSPHLSSRPAVEEEVQVPNFKYGVAQNEAQNDEDGAMQRTRVIVEHFDPVSGWHERRVTDSHGSAITASATKGDVPKQSKRTHINRGELAKIARIKRPSTAMHLMELSLRRQGAVVKDIVDNRVEQELQRISASDMVDGASGPRAKDSDEAFVYETTLKTVPNDLHSAVISPHHDKVDDKSASDSARKEKGGLVVPQLSQTIIFNLDHEVAPELQNGVDMLRDDPLFLGLPFRGFSARRGPPQTVRDANTPLELDHKNYFIHQMQKQLAPYELSSHEEKLRKTGYQELDMLATAGATTEFEGFECSNIHEEDLSNLYATADGYVDNTIQQISEEFEDHEGKNDQTGSWHFRSAHVDVGLEPYELEELDQESYECNQIIDGLQSQQPFVHNHTHVEQEDDYQQYMLPEDDHMQVFWRPHHPY